MNTMELVHSVATGEVARCSAGTPMAPFESELVRPARAAIVRARQLLLSEQRSDGSWLGRQTCDVALASQCVLMLVYLGDEQSPLAEQAAATILSQQLASGGWPLVPAGPADLSVSVQAYFALKLSGIDPSDERLTRARQTIRQLGGADAADATTRFFLALLGQIDYDCCPETRRAFLMHDGQLEWITSSSSATSAYSEAAVALISSHRAVRDIRMERGVRELFVNHPRDWPIPADERPITVVAKKRASSSRISAAIRHAIRAVWRYPMSHGWIGLRRRTLDRAEAVVRLNLEPERLVRLDFCSLLWHRIALNVVGYAADSPQCQACCTRVHELIQLDEHSHLAHPQLHGSAIRDTVDGLRSLIASGVSAGHPCALEAVAWLHRQWLRFSPPADVATLAETIELLQVEAQQPGNAQDALPPNIHVRSKRSSRSHDVELSPSQIDGDDTSLIRCLFQSQNQGGGWGAPRGGESAPDVTARALIALAALGPAANAPAVRQAVEYLRTTQRADGSWDSATGVRFIHGTSLAVRGLQAVGVNCEDDAVAAGLNWLVVHQHESGGWGETAFAEEPTPRDDFVPGPLSASQTAWALLALIAAGRTHDQSVCRGIAFLLDAQQDDGRWRESTFVFKDAITGHWFDNDLQAIAGPLLALSRWTVAVSAGDEQEKNRVVLRLVAAGDR